MEHKVHTADDVAALLAALGEAKAKRHAELMHGVAEGAVAADAAAVEMAEAEREHPPVEFEVTQFGLALDMRDPISGKIFALARPEKDGQAELMTTAKKAEEMLAAARKPVLEKRKAEAGKAAAAQASSAKAAEAHPAGGKK